MVGRGFSHGFDNYIHQYLCSILKNQKGDFQSEKKHFNSPHCTHAFVGPAVGFMRKKEEKVDLSDSKYVGTWKATTLALKDESEELGASYVLTLNGDGTGQFVDAENISYITWELTEDGFRTKGDTKLRFTDNGDNIKTNIIGVDMIFERQ